MSLTQSWIDKFLILFIFGGQGAKSQSYCSHTHWINMCSKISGALLQRQHSIECKVSLYLRIDLVGTICQAIFHKRFLSLVWTFSFHKTFQSAKLNWGWLEKFESLIALYADLTENSPDGGRHQKTWS